MKARWISVLLLAAVALPARAQTEDHAADQVPDKKPGTPRGGIFTWVLEKTNGTWLIIASGNTENKAPIPGGG